MVNFYEQLRSTTSYLANRKTALIVGGGRIPQQAKGQHIDDLVIAVNLAFLEVQNTDIIIIKNRKTLNALIDRKLISRHYHYIVPHDILNAGETSLFERVTYLSTNDFSDYELNPLQNLPVFCLSIAANLGCKSAELAGFSFDTEEYSGTNKAYNEMYFKQQKKSLDEFLAKTDLSVRILRTNQERAGTEHRTVTQVINDRLARNETIIVAEFTNNHLGDFDHLMEMVDLASQQGADLIKVQKRDVNLFYTQAELDSEYESNFGKTLGDYRHGVELDQEKFEALNTRCAINGIPWFSTVLDWNSLEFLNGVKRQQLIKLPSTISNFKNFLTKVADEYEPERDIVISTGATSMEYVTWVLDHFYNHKRRIFLLHTLSAYPTPLDEINVGVINLYKKLQQDFPLLIPGYSGHDIGNFGTQMAVAAGAQMVEKHVKLEETEWIHFGGVAANLRNGEFGEYVKAVRQADLMRGKEQKIIHSIEHHKYKPNAGVN